MTLGVPTAPPAIARQPAGRRSILPPLGTLPTIVCLIAGLVVPVSVFFLYSFWEARLFQLVRTWTFDRYAEVIQDPLYRGLIVDTLLLAFSVAVIVSVVAYAGAYAMRFGLGPRRRTILLLIVASALASYLVRIYSWKAILSPNGVFNWAAGVLGLIEEPLNLLGRFGVTITLVHILLPVALLPIYAGMQSVSPDVLRAARDLGAGPVQTFFRVTLPLTGRGLTTGFLLAFILSAGDYVTPQLVGGRGSLMVGRVIYDQFGITGNFPLASALSFSLILGAAAFFAGLYAAVRLVALVAGRLATPGARALAALRLPALPDGPRRVPWSRIVVGALLVFLYFPLVLVVVLSFNDLPIASFPFRGVTLRWYADIFADPSIRRAFATSIQVAVIVALLSCLIAVPGAFAAVRRSFTLKPGYLAAVLLPISLPGVVLGFSILSVVKYLEWSPSLYAVVLGQVTYSFPFVMLIMMAALHGFDRKVEEAGRDLGCTRRGTLRRVTMPILLPVVAGAAIIVFAISMDEFIITNFLVGSDPTLPPVIWSIMNRRGIPPTVNAIATILIVLSLVLVVSVTAVLERNARRRALAAGAT